MVETKPRTFDANTAFILELVLGILGLLGIGYLYAGRTDEGVIRLVVFLLWGIIGWCTVIVLSMMLIGLCLIPFALAVQIGVPVWSAYTLKRELQAQGIWPAA